MPADIRTLPELLAPLGYASACIGHGPDFFRGFDRYAGYHAWMSWEDRPGRKAENLNDAALPVLDELARGARDGRPFLLFLRHMDPHAPYLPPAPFDRLFHSGNETDPSARSMDPVFAFAPFADFFRSWMPPGVTDIRYVVAQYDGALAYMDACIGRLLTRLDELGLREDTMVVLTADHGEMLDDNDCYFDHHGLYEPTLHVPLIFRFPGRLPAGRRVPGLVLQHDLTPTLLDLAGQGGLAAAEAMQGKSMLPVLAGERAANWSACYLTECTWMRKRGWREGRWKLIEALEPDFHGKPPVELYDLIADPGERCDLAAAEPEAVAYLRGRVRAWLDRRLAETGRGDPMLEYEIGLDKRIGSIATAERLQSGRGGG